MLKTGNTYVVPWADIFEWKDVREKLMSDNVDDIIRAYEIILMWKVKCDCLPACIECTAVILQVMIQEYLTPAEDITFKDHELRLAYSTALIRFINYIHDINNKNESLYVAAKMQNIPDWIITMRHDAAHGQNLPALSTLKMSAEISLKWLLENYWLHEMTYMTDFESSNKAFGEEVIHDKSNLQSVLELAVQIWNLSDNALKKSISSVSDLNGSDISHLQDFFNLCRKNDYIRNNLMKKIKFIEACINSFKNHEGGYSGDSISLLSLRGKILHFCKILTHSTFARNCLVHSILQENLTSGMKEKDWEYVIKEVQNMGCFTDFMKKLFELAGDGNENALKLLNSLVLSIERLRKKWSTCNELTNKCEAEYSKKVMERTVKNQCNLNGGTLGISLKLMKPPRITLEMIQDLLINPTKYPMDIIFKCLKFVEPSLPKAVSYNVESLIMMYCNPQPSDGEYSKDEFEQIFTIEDLKLEELHKPENKASSPEKSQDCHEWIRSTEDADVWSRCAIGLMPHQTIVSCDVPKGIHWKRKLGQPSNHKRNCMALVNYARGVKKFRSEHS